jgi:hypothetical protein
MVCEGEPVSYERRQRLKTRTDLVVSKPSNMLSLLVLAARAEGEVVA